MSQTLYTKKGRRYVPVREHSPEVFDSLAHGQYVVTVSAGSTRLRRVDTPASSEVLVAVEQMREAMQDAMLEANTPHLETNAPLTPKQQAAAEALRKELGDKSLVFRGASMSDIVDAGIAALMSSRDVDRSPLSVEDAIQCINSIAARCEDITVKILTVQKVIDYAFYKREEAPSGLEEHIRATDAWGVWSELNDLDYEEIGAIAYEAEKAAIAKADED
jgi:hypothetical protein